MKSRDPRIDNYIAKSPDFARPILERFRKLVHQGCPEVEETLKWSVPAFVHHGLLCMMAGFKQHVMLNFWKHALIGKEVPNPQALGQLRRLTSLTELPADGVLLDYIRAGVKLNEAGAKTTLRSRPKPRENRELVVPDYLLTAFAKNNRARAAFEKFSYSHRKEYVEWLTEAKREETRQKRLQTAIKWLAEGKSRNWKYEC